MTVLSIQTIDLNYEVATLTPRVYVEHCLLSFQRLRQTVTVRYSCGTVDDLLPDRTA